jgi:hypothetical protein
MPLMANYIVYCKQQESTNCRAKLLVAALTHIQYPIYPSGGLCKNIFIELTAAEMHHNH